MGFSRQAYWSELAFPLPVTTLVAENKEELKSFLMKAKEESEKAEIKRLFLLGRKAMTNLNNILKSRDITLPTKVRIVKVMVFPVVMYGCENWTIKLAEC